MITAIIIFFGVIIGVLVFTLVIISVLRRKQIGRNSNRDNFSGYSILNTSQTSSDEAWDDQTQADAGSYGDSSDSSSSSGDSGGSSGGGD